MIVIRNPKGVRVCWSCGKLVSDMCMRCWDRAVAKLRS